MTQIGDKLLAIVTFCIPKLSRLSQQPLSEVSPSSRGSLYQTLIMSICSDLHSKIIFYLRTESYHPFYIHLFIAGRVRCQDRVYLIPARHMLLLTSCLQWAFTGGTALQLPPGTFIAFQRLALACSLNGFSGLVGCILTAKGDP